MVPVLIVYISVTSGLCCKSEIIVDKLPCFPRIFTSAFGLFTAIIEVPLAVELKIICPPDWVVVIVKSVFALEPEKPQTDPLSPRLNEYLL